jgi:RimJ/RimL family protein N-acetyltransferase
MNPDISLHGATVDLIPLSGDHVGELATYSAERSLWTWWLRPPPVDVAILAAEIEAALEAKKLGERVPFAVWHRGLGHCIGSTSFWKVQDHRSIEIGSTWLGLPFHRSGVNRECKNLLLAHAFGTLGLNRVVLQTDALNLRSRGAIEKLGAKLEGILRDNRLVWDGRVRSSAIYSILKREWLPPS